MENLSLLDRLDEERSGAAKSNRNKTLKELLKERVNEKDNKQKN